MQSVEYATLKELAYSTENLKICVDSQLSVIGCFWTSELPAPNERGEFVNQKQLDQVGLKQKRGSKKRGHNKTANLQFVKFDQTLFVITKLVNY